MGKRSTEMHPPTVNYRGAARNGRPRALGERLQLCAVLPGLILAPLWAVLAVVSFPWIVGPDSDFQLVDSCERASIASLGLAVVTAISVALAWGFFTEEERVGL